MLRRWNTLQSWAVKALEHRHLPWVLGALAALPLAPALRLGLLLDDYIHKASLLHPPQLPQVTRTPFDLFHVVRDQWSFNGGFLPWWISPEVRISFMRPLTGLMHAFDFALWQDQPHWIHLHSLLWLAAIVAIATLLYRRLTAPLAPGVAGLTALMFALDDAHAIPASWIADRYALVAGFFAFAALLAYDRWRRDQWRPGRWLTPLGLGLGLLSGETALGGFAYLASYALFVDPGTPKQRLRALVPSAMVGIAWVLAYKLLGFGTSHSAIYIDPARSPLIYLQALLERAPLLLMGQLGFPPSDLASTASRPVVLGLVGFAVAGLVLFATLLWPLLRREPLARFWGLGMLLSLLPVCATLPSDRLLLLPGLGGMALVSLFVAEAFGRGCPHPAAWRWLARPFAGGLLAVHLVLAPLAGAATLGSLRSLHNLSEGISTTFPADAAISAQYALVLHPPTFYFTGMAEIMHALEGRPIPARSFTLASGLHPLMIDRSDAHTLVIRPEGGFLLRPGDEPPGRPNPALMPRRILQMMDWLIRDADEPFPSLPFVRDGIRLEILEWTSDARPAVVSFRFPAPLEDPRWR